jgi:hypothetical protein
VVTMALASQTSVFFSSWSEATEFPVFVDGVGEPVDPWVISYGTVSNIDQNDLKIFEGWILLYKKKTVISTSQLIGNKFNSQ